MYTKLPKKLLPFNILEILQRHTDENHRLSQKDIQSILERDYDMTVERKSIKRNLMGLIEMGYEIDYTTITRMTVNKMTGEKEENNILTGFYLIRDFTDSELRLLIDSVLFSDYLPYSQCRDLVKKLENLSSDHFRRRVRYVCDMPRERSRNQELFFNLDLIDDAIAAEKQIRLVYEKDGNKMEMRVSPYQMMIQRGMYLLICCQEKHDHTSTLRLDCIKDVSILDKRVRPYSSLCDSDGQSFCISRYYSLAAGE